ncbi:podocan [Protopterus annectens]|uniref:podocan n=1 Tax=Protopterus annectens TaxID=7888 RepID=UPI001CFA3E33|nr:podocan [Protopterus annectens]
MAYIPWSREVQLLCLLACNVLMVQCETEEDNEFYENHFVQSRPRNKVSVCPKSCSCTQEGVVDCGGVDLQYFPDSLPENTHYLSLQNNRISKIPKEVLLRLPKLETLNLQNNNLTSNGLPEEAFTSLTHLNYLYLANNKLTIAPKYLPSTLVSADFAANNLAKVYPLTFGQKPNLRSVYLHNNKLTDAGLPDPMFNGSDSVEILILSSNFLKYVPKNLPSALNKLHLKSNKLQKIPTGAFTNLHDLRELYLQNNYITNEGIDDETFTKLSSMEYLDLSSNNLTQIPAGLPRNIVILHLEKNAIKSIPKGVLTQIRNLEYLLLQNNKIKAKDIHPLSFLGLKKLHTVHLYNNMLERIPSGLPRRAKTLMLLHNQITEIARDDFSTTYVLMELNLSYNKITSHKIHKEAFRKLRMLESLDLSGNNLDRIPGGLPQNLQILKLKENDISIIPPGSLSKLTKLKELYLSNNKLKQRSFHPGTWKDLRSLQTLDLAGNQLTDIPRDLPESLEYLYLQNNMIAAISENELDSVPNLKGIFLRFNRLTRARIRQSIYEKLKQLQVLDVEGTVDDNEGKNDNVEEELEEEEEEMEEEEEEEEEEYYTTS